MGLKIKEIVGSSNEEWDGIWQNCDHATYCQSREWAEFWSRYTDHMVNPSPKTVCFSDGKKGLLPLSIRNDPDGKSAGYIMCAGLSYGGWLSSEALSPEHEQLLTSYLLEGLGRLIWLVNPFQNISTMDRIVRRARRMETRVIDLKKGFDAIFKTWNKGPRYGVRRAQREGVKIRVATSGDEWTEFYETVYEDAVRRWGDNTGMVYQYKRDAFVFKSKNIKLWLAEYDRKIIAGTILSYSRKHVEGGILAVLHDYFKLRPSNLLAYECIRDCCERGYQWFDMGSSTNLEGEVQEGIVEFKRGFGARELPWYRIDIEPEVS